MFLVDSQEELVAQWDLALRHNMDMKNTIKQSKNFEIQLNNLINNCGLNIDTAYYILKSVLLDVENTYNVFLLSQENEEQKQEQKEIKIGSLNEEVGQSKD